MIILSWNCRGLGHTRAVPNLRELIKVHRPVLVFLTETLVNSNKVEELRISLGFDGAFSVDREGRSGGLAVLWRYAHICTIMSYSKNHIDLKISEPGHEEWRLTGFYGFPETTRRRQSWALIRNIASLSTLPWCMIGDYNDILNQSEKRGQIDRPEWMIRGFRDAIADCDLHDIPLQGHPFTWERHKGQPNSVEEQLDRAMASSAWHNQFDKASLLNLIVSHSDHSPILLDTEPRATMNSKWTFRFENRWLKEQELPNIVQSHWTSYEYTNVIEKLQGLSTNLSTWNRYLNRDFKDKIAGLKNQIDHMRSKTDPTSSVQIQELKDRLSNLLTQNEAFWKQRAKQFWLKEGDMNTKFFHSMATKRKERNRLRKLTDDSGITYDTPHELHRIAHDYFVQLFTANEAHYAPVISQIDSKVTAEDNANLLIPFTSDEFRMALFQMHPDKSPGPDGYNPAFFQRFWPLISEDVTRSCITWLEQGSFPASINDTIITLIPKCNNPMTMKDLRPISLCNVLYRIMAKVLANRLQKVLPHIISCSQAAFVPERFIIDNVIIAFEIIHHMKRKRQGKHGEAALKIDISKAYDRIDWGFLEQMLISLGFDQRWVRLMMLCVSTVKYSIKVNDDLVGSISPGRGLRQGCPLSPYLFIICAQGLSNLIDKAVSRGHLHGTKICRGAPIISHLFFADDSFFFFRASTDECNTLKHILNTYEQASGQTINLQKSGIFYSRNTDQALQNEMSGILGVASPLDTGKYLGLPSLIGSRKRVIFGYLRENLWKRFQTWKGNSLSAAGRDVLLRAVAHALPTYCMNCFLLPQSVLDELQKMMNSFWWGPKSNGARGIHWLSWDRLCVRKELGGLGYRNLEGYNLAMLAKQGWKLISAPDALSSRLLKAKYFPKNDFLTARLGSNPSFIWRSIWCSQAILARGILWKIGNGQSISVVKDPWLRDSENFYLQTTLNAVQCSMRVHDLIDHGLRHWNFSLLQDMLQPRDIEEIMRIPLPSLASEDILVWHFSHNGLYTVKSGYKLLMENITEASNLHVVSGNWTRMWKTRLPPKVKIFLWRAARNCIPCRHRLRHLGIDVSTCCVLCGTGYENNWHLFIDCLYAQTCWRLVKLSQLVNDCANDSQSFQQWFFRCLDRCGEQEMSTMAMVLWSIWRYRNDKLWNATDRPANVNISLASDLLQQWIQAQRTAQIPQHHVHADDVEIRWKPPPPGIMKCNIDAAIFKEMHLTGGAAIIRDSMGEFMVCRLHKYKGLLEVREAEAKALLEALTWAVSLELQQIIFETDSKLVAEAVNSKQKDRSEFGTIIAECCSILSREPNYKVRFVRRQANMVAHTLAKATNSYASPRIFYDAPTFISEFLSLDCNNLRAE